MLSPLSGIPSPADPTLAAGNKLVSALPLNSYDGFEPKCEQQLESVLSRPNVTVTTLHDSESRKPT
jgi:hypothetical protein